VCFGVLCAIGVSAGVLVPQFPTVGDSICFLSIIATVHVQDFLSVFAALIVREKKSSSSLNRCLSDMSFRREGGGK